MKIKDVFRCAAGIIAGMVVCFLLYVIFMLALEGFFGTEIFYTRWAWIVLVIAGIPGGLVALGIADDFQTEQA